MTKATYVYSSHKTRESAESALEDYFATGEVFESELEGIHWRGCQRLGTFRYDIHLYAE